MRLIHFVRERLPEQLRRRGAPLREIKAAQHVLDPNALTIGFARRFATYKRADLIFSQINRLEKLVNHAHRPIQIIFAGKAHPQDRGGQAILRRLFQMTQRPRWRGKIILLENYDMEIGRHLVQGVDLWLNNPRRPLEASGTSGQKVPLSGGINCSILDGWWDEGYDGENGWAIGKRLEGLGETEQDRLDAAALYEVLEREVIPSFYRRDKRRLPRQWLKKAKASMATVIPQFNTEAMVKNYVEKLYVPALQRGEFLKTDRFAKVAEVAKIKVRLRENWPLVHITQAAIVTAKRPAKLDISAGVYLAGLNPDLVQVELCSASPSQNGKLETGESIPMQAVHRGEDGVCQFHLTVPKKYGAAKWQIRVLPRHPALRHKHELGLMQWADLE
jgi:starch phosphorylase